jgi:hypothetical protein
MQPFASTDVTVAGPPRLLLPHRSAVHRITVWGNVLDLDSHHIATAKLAVDGQVKQGQVTYTALQQQASSDRPNVLWT